MSSVALETEQQQLCSNYKTIFKLFLFLRLSSLVDNPETAVADSGYTHTKWLKVIPQSSMTVWEKEHVHSCSCLALSSFSKNHFATKPFTKPQGKTIFQKAIKIQKQGSRNQAKIIPQNSAVAKKGRKPNFHSSLEKTFKKNLEN